MPRTEPDPQTPTTRAVWHMAWPLTFKAIMLHGIVVIDTYLVSALGEEALAAMGLAAAMAGMLLGALLAFSNATQIRFAQAFGTGEPSFLKSTLYAGLAINLVVCLAGLVVLGLAGGPIIDAFAHDPWIATQAKRYLAVFTIVILGEAVGQCLSSYFNGCGETKVPLYSYLLSVPVNVFTSVIFIHGLFGAPELGVVGAAVGSAIAVVLQVGFLAVRFIRRTAGYRGVEGWRNGTFPATVRRHLVFALPIAATFVSATLATNVCTLLYAKLGVNDFAAMTLIMPWVTVAGTVGMSWAQATGIIVAQLLGQNRTGNSLDTFLSGAWRAAFVAAGVVSALSLVVVLASPWLYAGLHPDTTATLLSFLPVLLLLPFPKGSNAICGNTLRAGGETVYVMHVFVWSQWLFRVPATALMVLYLDVSAAWVFSLLLFEEVLKFPAFHSRLYKGQWKHAEILA